MKYHLNNHAIGKSFPHFCFYDEAFTEEQLQEIEKYCEGKQKHAAGVQSNLGTEIKHTDEIRKTNIAWIQQTPETLVWMNRFHEVVKLMNDGFYNMDLTCYEDFQYTCYDSKNSKYDFHMDAHLGAYSFIQRKMTAILVLSKPDEYVGGKFQFKTDNFEQTIEQPRGRMIFFPSFILHRVTPIESGERRTLVNWIAGPHFK